MALPIPRIVGMGTATPPRAFTQEEVLELMGYTQPAARKIFLNSDIDKLWEIIQNGNVESYYTDDAGDYGTVAVGALLR